MITQFGNYLLDEALAQGGMARVYRARLRGLAGFEKPLVVKQVLPDLAGDPRFVEMFVREAKTLVAMSHPHIVSVYELGIVDGVYFLAMEYVEGATIAEIVQRGGGLSPAPCAQLMLQVCDALEYAHDRFGILHRDLSPRNIIVDRSGHARLLDFGISTHVDSDERAGFGSIGYMAPEQLAGESVSPRSDLFALGAVFYEALVGKPAFLREDRQATKRAVLEQPPPSLDAQAFPPALVSLVDRLLAREPAARPQAAKEVGRELRGYLSQAAPEGALGPLAERVEQARTRRGAADGLVSEEPGTAPVQTDASSAPRTLATSPLLDEARRKSAPKPVPRPAPSQESTRPITGRGAMPRPPGDSAASQDAHGEASAVQSPSAAVSGNTASLGVHRLWPWLAVLALGAALAWGLGRIGSAPAGSPELPSEPEPAVVQATPAQERSLPLQPPPAADPPVESEPPSASEPEDADPVPSPAAASRATAGSLEVNALPWAELRLDGQAVGTTPLRRRAVAAGKHTLIAHCPPLGRRAEVPFVVREGQATRVVIDLQAQPPKITVR